MSFTVSQLSGPHSPARSRPALGQYRRSLTHTYAQLKGLFGFALNAWLGDKQEF